MDGLRYGNRYTFYEKNATYRGKLLETRIIPSGLKYRPNIQYIYVLCNNVQQYPPGTQENNNSFESRDLMMEKDKELKSPEGRGRGKGEPGVPPNNVVRIVDIIQITKIETLSQILGGKTRLNDDVLSLIDEFF
jgi:hypothetical protein